MHFASLGFASLTYLRFSLSKHPVAFSATSYVMLSEMISLVLKFLFFKCIQRPCDYLNEGKHECEWLVSSVVRKCSWYCIMLPFIEKICRQWVFFCVSPRAVVDSAGEAGEGPRASYRKTGSLQVLAESERGCGRTTGRIWPRCPIGARLLL